MNSKRDTKIAFNTYKEFVKTLKEIANENEYTTSELVHRIVGNFLMVPEPNKIFIQPEELIKIAKRIEAEKIKAPIGITIEANDNIEKQRIDKKFTVTALEPQCGQGFYSLGATTEIREEEIQSYFDEHPETITNTMLTRNTNEITIMLKDLFSIIEELKEEAKNFPNEPLGVEISIGIFEDQKTGVDVKKANIAFLHLPSGGNISLNNDLQEITTEYLKYIRETGHEPNM